MGKTIHFAFYTMKAIHKQENRQEQDLSLFFRNIENKPLNIREQQHRYIY